VERIAGSELAARIRMVDGLVPDDPLGDPLLVVDLDGCADDATLAEALGSMLRSLPVVAVALGAEPGAGGLPAAFDVAVPDASALEPVRTAVGAHPLAAVALAVLLRGTADRSVPEGLAAESATYALLQAGPDHQRWLTAHIRDPGSGGPTDRPAVRTTRVGHELRLTLDRPGVHNAFNHEMREGLLEGLAVASADPMVQVVIDGAGPSFCSGGDLAQFGDLPDPATAHVVRLARSVGRVIASLAERVTVRVHGSCVGAGIELPAFAGHVVADPDAHFWLPEVGMGLIPGAGGTVSIPRRIGRQRTAQWALTGEVIDAGTALKWGLVDAVVPSDRGAS